MGQEDVIARRYARGLAEQAAAAGEVTRVRHDVRLLSGLLDPRSGDTYVPEFAKFLAAPEVDAGDKLAAAANIAKQIGMGGTTSAFLSVLIARGRADLMPRIGQAFAVIVGELTGEHTAMVHTARRLTDDQAARLTHVLSNALGGAVHLHQRVEPGLLAGAKVTVGDRTFDGSVLGKLERMKDTLITRGVANLLEDIDQADAAASEN